MVTEFCIICGGFEGLENHHLTPRSEGGTDEKENMITLCNLHHGKIHLMTKERKNIPQLIRNAMAAKKARGEKMGTPNLTPEARAKGAIQGNLRKTMRADAFAMHLTPIIRDYQEQGQNLSQIAASLNASDIRTARGKAGTWTPQAVKNVLLRGVS